jgi:hypothetical protein
MELLIAILVTVILFVLALYRTGYKNGYMDGFKFGKEDAEKEYRIAIEELERLSQKDAYYR